MLDQVTGQEPQVVVGSSMGGWIALHLALQRPHLVKVHSADTACNLGAMTHVLGARQG